MLRRLQRAASEAQKNGTNGPRVPTGFGSNLKETNIYIVVGGTVASMAYACRILKQNTTNIVYHLFEGPNQYNNGDIYRLDYAEFLFGPPTSNSGPQANFYNMYPVQVLQMDQSSMMQPNMPDPTCPENTFTDCYPLYLPIGLGADAVTTYKPQMGPILNKNANPNQLTWIKDATVRSDLTSAEETVIENVQTNLNETDNFGQVVITCALTVESSAIMGVHRLFLTDDCVNPKRYLAQDVYYALLNQATQGRYFPFTDIVGWNFTNNNDGTYTVIALQRIPQDPITIPVEITGKLVFKMLPWDSIRIATQGGLDNLRNVGVTDLSTAMNTGSGNPLSLMIPVSYRACYAIPIGNNNENNNQLISMTLRNKRIPCNYVSWIVDFYTVTYDPKSKQLASEGNTLLVVEATYVCFTRLWSWNTSGKFSEHLNEDCSEQAALSDFKTIVNAIYKAYTTSDITVPDIEEVCTSSGACLTKMNIEDQLNFLNANYTLFAECSCLYPGTTLANNLV